MRCISSERFHSAETSNSGVRLPIGDSPGYFGHLIPDSGMTDFPELFTAVQFEPLSGATVEGVSVAVSQLELDVLVICFNGFRTNPEFLRDPARSR